MKKLFVPLTFALSLTLAACGSSSSPSSSSSPAPSSTTQSKPSNLSSSPSTSVHSVASSSSSSAVSQVEVKPSDLKLLAKQLVETASHDRMTVVRVFDLPANVRVHDGSPLSQGPAKIKGLVLMPLGPDGQPSTSGSKTVAFMTSDAQYLMPGPVFNGRGDNLNQTVLQSLGLRLSPEKGLSEAASPQTHSFMMGTKGPLLTIFMDPNCIYCHKLFEAIYPKLKAGQVRARFVMVGFLKQSSIPKAVSILASKDPAKALHKDETHFNVSQEEGGIKPLKNLPPDLLKVVQANTALLNKIESVGTPLLIHCSKASGKVELIKGLPQDLDNVIANSTSDAKVAQACSK